MSSSMCLAAAFGVSDDVCAPEPPKSKQAERHGYGNYQLGFPPSRAMNVEPPRLNDNNPPVARPPNERKNLKYVHDPPRKKKTSRLSSISSWSSSWSLAPAFVLPLLDSTFCLTKPLGIQPGLCAHRPLQSGYSPHPMIQPSSTPSRSRPQLPCPYGGKSSPAACPARLISFVYPIPCCPLVSFLNPFPCCPKPAMASFPSRGHSRPAVAHLHVVVLHV